MKRKSILALIALIAVFALTGCGKDKPAAEPDTADQTWALSDWDLSATAWSSNNGATVTLTAIPENHYKDVEASFVARLEGEEADSALCQWEEDRYTAELDLNAADGYCYYLVMRSPDGAQAEFEVNTPANPSNGKLINMAYSLDAYCHMTVTGSSLSGSELTITEGTAEVRLPLITQNGEEVAITNASLVLFFAGAEVDRQTLTLPQSQSEGVYEPQVKDTTFQIPQLEDDQQLALQMEITLNDGQVLTAPGGTWIYSDGQMTVSVG